MRQVWKFVLPLRDVVSVEMPAGAKCLHVAVQCESLCVWALVDPDTTDKEVRRFRIAGTGHPIESFHCETHVGSVLMHGGNLVFHVFEIG